MDSATIVLVFSERALISQGKSFGCLRSVMSFIDSQSRYPYLTNTSSNAAGGVMCFPAASMVWLMSSAAIMHAAASQMLESANSCPGQTLDWPHRINGTVHHNHGDSLWTHRRPNPKTTFRGSRDARVCGSISMKRSGRNVPGVE